MRRLIFNAQGVYEVAITQALLARVMELFIAVYTLCFFHGAPAAVAGSADSEPPSLESENSGEITSGCFDTSPRCGLLLDPMCSRCIVSAFD